MFTDRAGFRIAVLVLAASVASGQVTRRVSVDAQGNQGDFRSYVQPSSLSADGRWVAFESFATDLVPGDTDFTVDVFVADRLTRAVECVTVDPNGVPVGGTMPSISADGRFVAFQSNSPSILPGLSGQYGQIFVRDRSTGTTEIVSVDANGLEGDNASNDPRISADGSWVAFECFATNIVQGPWNGFQIALRDRLNSTTELVSVSSGGVVANDVCYRPAVSSGGRYVAFETDATNLVPGDSNGLRDIFLRDRLAGTTERVNVADDGTQANGFSSGISISADGRFIAFSSQATNLVPADTNGTYDAFLRDRQLGTTELVSVSSAGIQGNDGSGASGMSSDGRYVVIRSAATNLCPDDTNQDTDVFLRDRQTGITERVNVSSGQAQQNPGLSYGGGSSVSDDGRYVSFDTTASNLVPLDTNGQDDVFLRDRMPGSETTAFTSLCIPGSGSVIACPCSNPPSGPDRGCDNSDATGGASLSAAGNTELSADGLQLTASGMRTSALSVLAQGTTSPPNGLAYGQGVRCVGGMIRRLYNKSAQGGAATFPDFQAGESPISVRSAQKGDSIQPGQSRWYIVYYRDPVVLGGCPASSTFNTTQTGEIAWSF